MSSSLQEKQDKIVAEFAKMNSWEDRYKKLIEIGKALPQMPEKLKTEDAKVKGCQSQVWLHAHLNDSNRIEFQGDSDALIVRGLVALLIQLYSNSTPEEVLKFSPTFIRDIGFSNNLSPSRTNGLMSMIKQIMNFATVFSFVVNKTKN